jgi:hypothetical protein
MHQYNVFCIILKGFADLEFILAFAGKQCQDNGDEKNLSEHNNALVYLVIMKR